MAPGGVCGVITKRFGVLERVEAPETPEAL